MLDLSLVTDNPTTIQQSFDRIAADLLANWELKINTKSYSFTEIEFYLYIPGVHEDEATHKHDQKEPQWRSHNAGLDITLPTLTGRGGILLRGIRNKDGCINGPRRVIQEIFKCLGSLTSIEKEFGLVPKTEIMPFQIWKTTRHGLSASQGNEFKDHDYRYYADLEDWVHVSPREKEKIRNNSRNFLPSTAV